MIGPGLGPSEVDIIEFTEEILVAGAGFEPATFGL